LGFEGDNLAFPVKNGTISLDRSSDQIVIILEIDNENFRLRCFIGFLADT
jgi:hypothetical protein